MHFKLIFFILTWLVALALIWYIGYFLSQRYLSNWNVYLRHLAPAAVPLSITTVMYSEFIIFTLEWLVVLAIIWCIGDSLSQRYLSNWNPILRHLAPAAVPLSIVHHLFYLYQQAESERATLISQGSLLLIHNYGCDEDVNFDNTARGLSLSTGNNEDGEILKPRWRRESPSLLQPYSSWEN
jgi:hypothetical protein